MATNQPVWKQVAQLGDVNPLDYGGLFVYVDTTGVYPPEMERVQSVDGSEDGDITEWETRRVVLDNLKSVTFGDNVLIIPAEYEESWPHPLANYDEWFNSDLASVASYVGQTVEQMRTDICSEDPATRARVWEAIGNYHGWDNLDSYPSKWSDRAELEARYSAAKHANS